MAELSQEIELQIEQLRQTVLALLGNLEKNQLKADQSLQNQSADHEADKQQLIATITSLRRELEQQAEEHAIVLQRERAPCC